MPTHQGRAEGDQALPVAIDLAPRSVVWRGMTCQTRLMPVSVVLVDGQGHPQADLPDPAGGTFDAAGNLDRLLTSDPALPVWSTVDEYGTTEISGADLDRLRHDLDWLALSARPGPERNGLARLGVMIERCKEDSALRLRFDGD